MENVATKTQSIRPASAWRPDAYSKASPALRAIIEACAAADREADEHNKKTRPIAEAFFAEQKRVQPTDAELHAAMDAVPVPDCLRVPAKEPYAVAAGVKWSDGTETFQPLASPEYDTLRGDDAILRHYADDEKAAQRALAASDDWVRARAAAAAAVHKARRDASPEYRKNEAAMEERRRRRAEIERRQKIARRELLNFEAQTPSDRLAQIVALFEAEGGRITRAGSPRNIDDAFEAEEGTKLVALMFRALGEAADGWPPPDEDPRLLEAERVWDVLDAEEAVLSDTAPYDHEAGERNSTARQSVVDAIRSVPARTPLGLAIKAKVAAYYQPPYGTLDFDDLEWQVHRALVTDACALVGSAPPPELLVHEADFEPEAAIATLKAAGVEVWEHGFSFPEGMSPRVQAALAALTPDQHQRVIEHAACRIAAERTAAAAERASTTSRIDEEVIAGAAEYERGPEALRLARAL